MSDGEIFLLTEKEAATFLSMSSHFLRRDRVSEDSVGIPFVRIGAAVRYRKSDLLGWINSRLNMPHPKEMRASEHNTLDKTKVRNRSKKSVSTKADLPRAWLSYIGKK